MIRGTLEISTVIGCIGNMCSFCPQTLLMRTYGKSNTKMSMETFITCLSKVPKDISITFSGYAEAFLNPLAPQMMKYAYDQGYEVHLYTTLLGLKEEDLPILKEIGFGSKVLHLPDVQREMKTEVNDAYINIVTKFKEQIGYSSAICHGTLYPVLKNIIPDCFESNYNNLHRRAENVTTKRLDINHKERLTGKITCGVAHRHNMDVIRINVLLPSGQVCLCCMDYGMEHVIGDLLIDNYEDLFKSEVYKKLEEGFMDDTLDILCRKCHEAIQI